MNEETRQKLQELGKESDKLFQEKKWGAAIVKLDEMMALLPEDAAEAKAAVLNNRGNAKSRMGDHKGAIADYDLSLAINPQDAEVYNNRGKAKDRMDDYEGAIADYDRALAINPQSTKTYNNRGITKRKMGDYKDALADHDRAIGLNPQYAKAYSSRGVTKRKMGDYKDALADHDRAIEISPQYAKAYNNRGVTKRNMGDYKGAIADYDQALKIDPSHKSAMRNRGIALEMQESQKEREKFLEKHMAEGQTQAKEEFESTLKISTDLINTKEYDNARGEYEKEARNRGKWVWVLSCVLTVLAAAFYGLIAYLGFKEWQVAQSPMAMRSFSPLSLFPFVLMVTLALSPLAWVIRMLNRDKHKYWVLREDAVATRKMLLIIKTGHEKREDLWLQLFDHHDKRGGAHLIADWNHSDGGGGNNFTIKPGGD